MTDKNRSDNASESVSLGSTKSKQKLKQKTLFDLFPKKQKPSMASSANATPNDVQQERPEPQVASESQLALDYASPELSVPALPIQQPAFIQTTPTQGINTNQPRFPSPEIQILESISSATGVKDNPIVVDSSPVRPSLRPPPKSVYSIFAPRTRKEPSISPVTPTTLRASNREAPFPDRASQHVRGQQTTFSVPPIALPPRRHTSCASNSSALPSDTIPLPIEVDSTSDSTDVLRVETSSSRSIRTAHLSTIPAEHLQSHPVIAHLVQTATTENETVNDISHRLWTDKWQPSRAGHILGNEKQATFLRDWLSALEVNFTASAPEDSIPTPSQGSGRPGKAKSNEKRGTKRPNVVRAVDKKSSRKRQRIDSDEDDDSWIVYSDNIIEDESPPIDNFFDDTEKPLENLTPRLYRRPSHSAESSSTLHPSFQNRLTNTILLSGPHSSGKTAAVYACAEELGWEVFEVYPGVGKRSGANLDHLVGEVGKNHLVRKRTRLRDSGTNIKRDGSLKSAFSRGKEKTNKGNQAGMHDDNRENSSSVTGFGFIGEVNGLGAEKDHEATPRQSLILLEEVDVLFKEDVGFWGALISLIRDCKRPVILTCNDTSFVPLTDLPLQDVLNFQLCSTTVATSFLQALCCAEGYLLDRNALSRFYDNPASLEIDLYNPDLRRAIHNLQLWCPANEKGTAAVICYQGDEQIEDALPWDWHSKSSDASTTYSIGGIEAYHAELVSFADCYLLRKAVHTPKEMGLEETTFNGMDDVLGYRALRATFPHRQFGYHDQDERIVSTAIELSRARHDEPPSSSPLETTRALLQARVQYDAAVQEIRNNVVGRSQIIRTPVFDLCYLPWIREMVAAEDRQEEDIRRRDEGVVGRRTRNSQKFNRMLELSASAKYALDATVLP